MQKDHLTPVQVFLLDALRQCGGLRLDQLNWLYEHFPGKKQFSFQQDIRQLIYLSKAEQHDGLLCALWQRPSEELLAAIDVMLALCEDELPEFSVCDAADLCRLVFFLPYAGAAPNCFRLYPVPPGRESVVCMRASTEKLPSQHTVLYMVQSAEQIRLLYCTRTYFAAAKGGDGKFSFWQGSSNEK